MQRTPRKSSPNQGENGNMASNQRWPKWDKSRLFKAGGVPWTAHGGHLMRIEEVVLRSWTIRSASKHFVNSRGFEEVFNRYGHGVTSVCWGMLAFGVLKSGNALVTAWKIRTYKTDTSFSLMTTVGLGEHVNSTSPPLKDRFGSKKTGSTTSANCSLFFKQDNEA